MTWRACVSRASALGNWCSRLARRQGTPTCLSRELEGEGIQAQHIVAEKGYHPPVTRIDDPLAVVQLISDPLLDSLHTSSTMVSLLLRLPQFCL